MAEGKYSLISVDAPEDDEEVIRVSAAGITRETSGAAVSKVPETVQDASESDSAAEPAIVDSKGQPEAQLDSSSLAASESAAESASEAQGLLGDAGDEPEEVPFANMQKAIIALLVLGLIAFAVYFVLAH